MRKTLFFLVLSLTLFALLACGGSGGGISGEKNNPSISISPMNPNLLVGQSQIFTANIQNLSDTRIAWSVQEENGGTIASTDSGGVYTAPWPTGLYHVVATSVAQPSLSTNTMVSVTAKFAFVQEVPSGDAVPYSMTPMFGTLGTDGKYGIAGVIDSGTGNPVVAPLGSIVLSPDGTKAAFDMLSADALNPGAYVSNIYIANSDGTGEPTQLTHDVWATLPQFSPDGTKIVYITDISGRDIYAMNADGSNQHPVFTSAANNDAWAYSASFSPDGAKMAAEIEFTVDGSWRDGIAIMNADGSNVVPLTSPSGCDGSDEMPAFTNDGTKVMFSEYCYSETASYEGLYTITVDGATRAPLLGGNVGIIHYNPIPVGDKLVFQSNQATPALFNFEVYGMNADGTGITQLTANGVYDGFDLSWWGLGSSSAQQQANARALHRTRTRAERIKAMQEHRR